MSFEAKAVRPRVMVENRTATHRIGGVRAEGVKRFMAELPDDADLDIEITDKGKFVVAKWTRRRAITPPSKDTEAKTSNESPSPE